MLLARKYRLEFKMYKLICAAIAYIVLTTSIQINAQTLSSHYQISRFEKQLTILNKALSVDLDSELLAKQLVSNPEARIAAFDLQALGKMYAKSDSLFEKMHRDFKEFEDQLGTVKKWIELSNNKKRQEALNQFADYISQNEWSINGKSPKLNEYINSLKKINWPKPNEDRQMILNQLEDDLIKIDKTNFNFEALEEGNGLHEFRREIRWFVIKARLLNGLLKFKKNNFCPSENLADILNQPIAKSKYATLIQNTKERNACQISQCLFVDLANVVEEIGQLKDAAEQAIGNTDSDKTPKKIKNSAEVIYQSLKKTNTLELLANELNECLSK